MCEQTRFDVSSDIPPPRSPLSLLLLLCLLDCMVASACCCWYGSCRFPCETRAARGVSSRLSGFAPAPAPHYCYHFQACVLSLSGLWCEDHYFGAKIARSQRSELGVARKHQIYAEEAQREERSHTRSQWPKKYMRVRRAIFRPRMFVGGSVDSVRSPHDLATRDRTVSSKQRKVSSGPSIHCDGDKHLKV